MSAIDTLWVLLGATLVFFMQAGFAMVETGFTRAKNAGNICMKNLMDFVCGTIVYWLIGFGIMYGAELIPGVMGTPAVASAADTDWTFLIFQTVFCATAATIVSGAMAERTKFKSYLVYSVIISLFVYPVSGHWIWGGGWLSTLGTPDGLMSGLGAYGFHDFAGSTAVHMVGGLSAFIGAMILGPRIGKYTKDGKSRAIPGHSITLGCLGVFILWFGWFGFNPASSLAIDGLTQNVGRIFVTTNMAAVTATLTAMCITWVKYGKPDVSMTLNGSLAGLVAITAGCSTVTVTGAAIIGMIAGFTVVFGVEFIDQKLKVDDPVGAVGVHGCCGAVGTLLVGIFAYFDPYTDAEVLTRGTGLGLVYGGGFAQLLVQLIGVLAVAAWVSVTMTCMFQLIKHTIGLRVSRQEELEGLDSTEHGLLSAYADFTVARSDYDDEALLGNVPVREAVPVELVAPVAGDAVPVAPAGVKITKIEILCNQGKFDALKTALFDIGITGMTCTNVMGCGEQRGASEYYRGVKMEVNIRPKLKVDIVVCKLPVSLVVSTAKQALYTGHIGDGKIFVYDVENVIKVRTGEEGYDALQDDVG
ncbi:ammonium transporter [Oscillibacter sp.]|uniref:ammonium transporter n=1 Tax=Oscillibacter sp. TaxID=1945593 RepID=UPI00289B289E|nr:ammonium transporter [Oscillibacter sp.]